LKFIAQQEKIDIEDAAINVLSKISRGSMRDAIGYLEQIGTIAAGKKITEEKIQKYFGITDRLGVLNIVKAILSQNVPLVLDQVNDMIMASVDIKQILSEISEIFRSTMIIKAQNGSSKLLDLPDNEIEELKKISEKITISQLLKMAYLFSDIEKKVDYNINERWIMEATLINCVASLGTKT
jgi:DNA polymerase-3 subunit gamma/tau